MEVEQLIFEDYLMLDTGPLSREVQREFVVQHVKLHLFPFGVRGFWWEVHSSSYPRGRYLLADFPPRAAVWDFSVSRSLIFEHATLGIVDEVFVWFWFYHFTFIYPPSLLDQLSGPIINFGNFSDIFKYFFCFLLFFILSRFWIVHVSRVGIKLR